MRKLSIPLVFTIDNSYSPHCATSIISSYLNKSPATSYNFIVLHTGLTAINRLKFYLLMIRLNQKIHLIEFNINKFVSDFNLPVFGHFKQENYTRLLLPSLLKSYNKVIYLDSDTVVLDDLSDLWNISISQYCLAAAKNNQNGYSNQLRLGLNKSDPYFNSGVMLLNLKTQRKAVYAKILRSLMLNPIITYANVDQDIINLAYRNKIMELPPHWNAQQRTDLLLTKEYEWIIANAKILHWLTGDKPWVYDKPIPYSDLYWKYRAQTPWNKILYNQKYHNDRIQIMFSRLTNFKKKNTKDGSLFQDDINLKLIQSSGATLPTASLRGSTLLSNRDSALNKIDKNTIVAEVGVAYGDFSLKILDIIKPREFYLIDIFSIKPGEPEFWGMDLLKKSNLSHYDYIKQRFSDHINKKTVKLRRGYSWEVLSKFKNNTFDYVYLDAAHDYESVKKDIQVLSRVVKPGGLIQFNDYVNFSPAEGITYGVIKAVNEFIIEGHHTIKYFCFHPLGFSDIVVRLKK